MIARNLPLIATALLAAAGCRNVGIPAKRESELNCPTDIRQTVPWCAGEDAIFCCPCGPSAGFYGHRPTCWRTWPASGSAWRDSFCGPGCVPGGSAGQSVEPYDGQIIMEGPAVQAPAIPPLPDETPQSAPPEPPLEDLPPTAEPAPEKAAQSGREAPRPTPRPGLQLSKPSDRPAAPAQRSPHPNSRRPVVAAKPASPIAAKKTNPKSSVSSGASPNRALAAPAVRASTAPVPSSATASRMTSSPAPDRRPVSSHRLPSPVARIVSRKGAQRSGSARERAPQQASAAKKPPAELATTQPAVPAARQPAASPVELVVLSTPAPQRLPHVGGAVTLPAAALATPVVSNPPKTASEAGASTVITIAPGIAASVIQRPSVAAEIRLTGTAPTPLPPVDGSSPGVRLLR